MEERDPWNPLRKSYPDSRKVNAVSLGAEVLYTRLLAQSDDRANYYGEPKLILSSLFGRRWANRTASVTKVRRWRDELVNVGLVETYTVDGETYLHLVKCKKILRTDTKRDHRFPEPVATKGEPETGPDPAPVGNESGPSDTYTDTDTETVQLPDVSEQPESVGRLGADELWPLAVQRDAARKWIFFGDYDHHVKRWKAACPDIDVEQQIRDCLTWFENTRPQYKDFVAFLGRNLHKTQRRAKFNRERGDGPKRGPYREPEMPR